MLVRYGNTWARYTMHAPRRINGDNIPLPNYRQQDEHSCGFLAALTVVRYFYPDTSRRTVLQEVRPSIHHGVDRNSLMDGLYRLGVVAGFRSNMTVSMLRRHVRAGRPVIVSVWPEDWISDHWVVVQGFSPDRIHLTNWPRCISLARFAELWSDMDMRGQGGSQEGLVCRPAQ